MKQIMMSAYLVIIAMTFSCTEKNVVKEVNTEKPMIEVVEEQKNENASPEISASMENEEVENEETKQVSERIKKRFIKKSTPIVEERKEDSGGIPIENEIDRVAVSEKIAKRTEKRVLVKTVKNESSNEVVSGKIAEKEVDEMAKPDHSVLNSLLTSHVTIKGVVDYEGLKKDIGKLDAYLSDLDKNTVNSDWSKNEKLAYWINAYNAFTIKLILDNYPVKSIQDIHGGKPWDKEWIKLGGKTYSLNQIENDIIRPQFGEPRIHFAVNCAAQSCPPLANKAFTAENLNSLLEKQAKSFINNSRFNTLGRNSVTISKIFDWYGKDFGDKITFLNKYADTEISAKAKIAYTEYDWGLNNK